MALATNVVPVPAVPPPRLPFALAHFSVSLPPTRIGIRIAASVSSEQEVQLPPVNDKNAAWKDFTDHVSGEWDGYGAEFSDTGVPLKLPSSVVPEAFQQWDVQLHDWQTQCPTLATKSLQYKMIRLLPTVGCEADAATQYSIDDREATQTDSGVEFLAFHNSGSYIAVWPGRRVLREVSGLGNSSKSFVQEGNLQNAFEVEHCLVQTGNPQFRVRILQQIAMQAQHDDCRISPVLKGISVQREKWESEFRNGEVLGGCAASGSAFATKAPLHAPDLEGTWQFDTFATESGVHLGGFHQLVSVGSETKSIKASKKILPLPEGLWSEMTVLEDEQYIISVGWLIDPGVSVISNCEFLRGGKTKRIVLRFGTRKD